MASSWSEAQVFVVNREGTCTLSIRVPELVGCQPWDWCEDADRERVREHFVQACMFRREQAGFQATFVRQNQKALVRLRLSPIDDGEGVLGTYCRVFEDVLTGQEHHILALVAGGATTAEASEVMRISESTVRSHVASIKTKLGIVEDRGLAQAAQQFGLSKSGG